jgi:hypothetical protein
MSHDGVYGFTEDYSRIKAEAEGCRQSEVHQLSETSGDIQEAMFKYNTGEDEK